jgi:lipopolysaccharide transport system ATP-binding protein
METISTRNGSIQDGVAGFFNPIRTGWKLFKISFFIKQWPNICGGNYIVSIGIADGSLEDHEQCQWIHESMVFESIPLRSPAGIFSVLDTNVEFTALKP